MARTAKKDTIEKIEQTENIEQMEEYVPINLEQMVTVKNIAGWTVGFARLTGVGDVSIPRFGSTRLSRLEIISQSQNGNKLFNGVEDQDRGDHATLIVQDKATLKELGFENAEVFSDKVVKDLFAIQNDERFESALSDKIRTRAEKYAIMLSIIRQKLNDYNKIRIIEQYTGFKLDKVMQSEKNIR